MVALRLAPLLGAALACGCYSAARINFAAHPELSNVRLAAKGEAKDYERITLVYAKARGFRSCSALSLEALKDLSAQARAQGGELVRWVQFRGRWYWMARAVCRNAPWGASAEVRGYAARPLPPTRQVATPARKPARQEPVAPSARPAEPEEPVVVGQIELPPDPPPLASGSQAECLAWQAYMEAELDDQAEDVRSALLAERAKRPDSRVVDDAWRSFEAQVEARRRYIETNSEACRAAARGE
jgi:hypothetical protein